MRIFLENGPSAGVKYEMNKEMRCVNLGSGSDNHIVLTLPGVSRCHACFVWQNEAWFIKDLSSTNGTWLNGARVTEPKSVNYHDRIMLGEQILMILEPGGHPETTVTVTEKIPKLSISSPSMTKACDILSFSAANVARPVRPEPGLCLGDYCLERRLGVGGMGEVWCAEQIQLGRKVAVKILNPEYVRNPLMLNRFRSEIKANAQLTHPNIVMAIDAGYSNGFHYLVVHYVDGQNLEEMIATQKTLDEKSALMIAGHVASALQFAWRKFKIVHRDIKPSNIMINRAGEVKLMDLGICKKITDYQPHSALTQCGEVIGTPYFMSPEQAQGDSTVDCQSDIYGLGATLFNVLTGTFPFDAPNPLAVLTRLLSDPTPTVRKVNSKVSKRTEHLVYTMMAKDRRHRYRNWDSVLFGIDDALAGLC